MTKLTSEQQWALTMLAQAQELRERIWAVNCDSGFTKWPYDKMYWTCERMMKRIERRAYKWAEQSALV